MRSWATSILVLALVCPAFAQQQQTRFEVTHAGVFQSDSYGPATVAPAGSTTRSPTASSLRWMYANPPGMNWITVSVSSGNHGTLAWLGNELNFERVSLLAPTDDQSPPLPIYEDLTPPATFANLQVAAADQGTGCAVLWVDPTAGVRELRYYHAGSATPVVLANPQAEEIRISADGKAVAVGYTDGNGDAAVTVYDPNLKAVTTLVGKGYSFRHHDISGDGRRVLIASGTTDFLYDIGSGQLLHQDGTTVSNDAHVVDGDGDTWGRGGFDIGVWRDNLGTWTRILNFNDTSLSGLDIYDRVGISADGSTFVATGRGTGNINQIKVYCWSLTGVGPTLLWTYSHTGSGPTLRDVGMEVSLSDDGRFIAVGTTGTEFGGHPEVLVFDRDAGSVPVATIDTPGSCMSVDISGDGQFVVAGTKAVHAETMGSGGEGYSLDLGAQGFWLSGTPSISRIITLNVNGAPGDLAFLWAGIKLLPAPLTVYPFSGEWWIDPTALILKPAPLATIPAGGTLPLPALLPNVPSAIGVEIFAQAARTGSANVIENHLGLLITP